MSRNLKNQLANESSLKSFKQKMYLSNINFITAIGDALFAKWIFNSWYQLLAEEFVLKINNDSLVVDIGCGPGDLLFELRKIYKYVALTGVDISSAVLIKAQKRLKKEGYNNIEFIQSQTNGIPIANGKYSFGYSTFSFHLWKEPVVILNEIYRIMSQGSEFVLIDFNGEEKHEKENLEYLYALADKTPFLIKHLIKSDIDWGYKIAGLYNLDEIKELIEISLFSNYESRFRSISNSPNSFLIEYRLIK